MRADFFTDDNGITIVSQTPTADGGHIDHLFTLPEGAAFGNLSYADLKAAGQGMLLIDEKTNTAEILKRGDPRLKSNFAANQHD